MKLLTRDEFRNRVFKRDNYKCVICGNDAQDAHHIMERRLFKEPQELGGYFLDNGSSLCGTCHIKAEETTLSCEDIREACGITNVLLPVHLYPDMRYDKWGNPYLGSRRLKGELYGDCSVQKIIKGDFTHWVKYPRTYHLPWSKGKNEDDRTHYSTEQWKGRRVICTVKMDGENTTMYNDYIHARSLDSQNHPTRNWVKNYWSKIAHDIPYEWRICGENLYAKHSIGYNNLESYFLGFSIWDAQNHCKDWQTTLDWFYLLEIKPVEVIYDGCYDEAKLIKLADQLDYNCVEGYVLRTYDSFFYGDFHKVVGKFVRPNHIQTTKHWMHGQEIERNELV